MDSEQLNSAIDDLASGIGVLVRRMRRASSSHELSLTQRAVLGRLARHGPMTTSDLARAEGMKPQSMGATVANLEETGLVSRIPHPTDGRQMNIIATERGMQVNDQMRRERRTWLLEAVSDLTEPEREILFEAAGIIKRLGAQ
ncbi:MAG: MarR family transcriptional regulator [Armatimonadetes bacterium]|nr:MarR family transcriptional regulator [Armatimonadota bacterium]MBS1701154.1 MarR family transcriptional regulator [Armatimonadota bacterium]